MAFPSWLLVITPSFAICRFSWFLTMEMEVDVSLVLSVLKSRDKAVSSEEELLVTFE